MPSITSALAIDAHQLAMDPAKSLVATKGGSSAREIAEHQAATSGRAANPKDVGEQFEAMYLRQMLNEMMPKDSDELFGDKTAGPMWRSMMVDTLATSLSKSGTMGLAKMVTQAHPTPTKEKS